ncbi:histidine phosphatase family protein [Angustibacter sp. McL0619]|uniref:histidine phosphatase family protein n=1 Tax=Angustibacter sp. McL0619 TaxID=3415676 RepID=UPI003CF5EFFC
MSQRTVVHLLRHGEVHNPEGVLYGRLPGYHLSDRGRRMADLVAEYLKGHDITTVVSSPLERAQETAAPIAAAHDVAVRLDVRLIEAGNYFEGMTFGVGDGSLRHPGHWPKMVNPFRPSWGEPYEQIAARMLAAVELARGQAAGHEAVLVSHQSPVWIARLKLEGRRLWHDPRKRRCSLASLTSLTFEDDRLLAIDFSEPAASLLPGASKVVGA